MLGKIKHWLLLLFTQNKSYCEKMKTNQQKDLTWKRKRERDRENIQTMNVSQTVCMCLL